MTILVIYGNCKYLHVLKPVLARSLSCFHLLQQNQCGKWGRQQAELGLLTWHLVRTYMSHITRKPVFGVSDQGVLKPACAVTETRQRLEILDIETRGKLWSTYF